MTEQSEERREITQRKRELEHRDVHTGITGCSVTMSHIRQDVSFLLHFYKIMYGNNNDNKELTLFIVLLYFF